MAKTGTHPTYVAYAFVSADVDDTTALSLEDLGFDLDDIRAGDVVYISIEGAAIRWRADGDDPTTDEGMPEAQDTKFDLWGFANLLSLKIIAQAGTATLNMTISRAGGRP